MAAPQAARIFCQNEKWKALNFNLSQEAIPPPAAVRKIAEDHAVKWPHAQFALSHFTAATSVGSKAARDVPAT